jgi:hypothetical protein
MRCSEPFLCYVYYEACESLCVVAVVSQFGAVYIMRCGELLLRFGEPHAVRCG